MKVEIALVPILVLLLWSEGAAAVLYGEPLPEGNNRDFHLAVSCLAAFTQAPTDPLAGLGMKAASAQIARLVDGGLVSGEEVANSLSRLLGWHQVRANPIPLADNFPCWQFMDQNELQQALESDNR